jgi:hypothetical protein
MNQDCRREGKREDGHAGEEEQHSSRPGAADLTVCRK